MNKFVNIVKLSMLTAVTAGLTIGTVVESAEALAPLSGWGMGTVSNAGNDPDEAKEQNIGFELLTGKTRISDNGSFIFKGAIENFFYTDFCDNGNFDTCNSANNNEQFNEFKVGFDVGDLRASLNDDKTVATYEILSNNFVLETDNEELGDNGNKSFSEPEPLVFASFELRENVNNSFIEDLDTIIQESFKQFFVIENDEPKIAENPDPDENDDGKFRRVINQNPPKIFVKDIPINFGNVQSLIGASGPVLSNGEFEGDKGTFVIKEFVATPPVKTTPEPGNIVSLLALGTLGAGVLNRRRVRINSNK
ncbi:MAG: PEP-CTERM sorting domain-containing protein [Rivularia sp. (in: Bacteria)]|nr:PEP-CTERM sorting domain-containing protein [Rivularia sp. MS3]